MPIETIFPEGLVLAHFSPETRAFLERSRLIALDLGYEYITTIHLFLSDCQHQRTASLRNFSFPTEAAYQNFYQSYRKEQASIFAEDSLPLTLEAEKAIRRGLVERRHRRSVQVEPHHILLGAAFNPKSLLQTIFRGKGTNLYSALEKYYINEGLLGPMTKRKWWQLF